MWCMFKRKISYISRSYRLKCFSSLYTAWYAHVEVSENHVTLWVIVFFTHFLLYEPNPLESSFAYSVRISARCSLDEIVQRCKIIKAHHRCCVVCVCDVWKHSWRTFRLDTIRTKIVSRLQWFIVRFMCSCNEIPIIRRFVEWPDLQ